MKITFYVQIFKEHNFFYGLPFLQKLFLQIKKSS